MAPLDVLLFAILAWVAEWRVEKFKAQEVANTAWAFAATNQLHAPLYAALARAAKWRVGIFKVQELANTAWAFATIS